MSSFKQDILETTVSYERHCKAKGLLLSLSMLSLTDLPETFKTFQAQFFKEIFASMKNTLYAGTEMEVSIAKTVDPNPSVREYVSRLLKIVLVSNDSLSQLKSYIFDRTLLKTEDTVVKHGEHFVNTYKNVIMEFICKNSLVFVDQMFVESDPEAFEQILTFLCDLCEFSHKKVTPEKGKEIKKALVEVILKHLPEVLNTSRNVFGSELHVVNLISKLMMIFTEQRLDKLDRENVIQSWYMEVMSKTATLLDIKTKALVLLPCFTGPESKVESEVELDKCLVEHLQEKHFPHQSHDLLVGSIQRDSYIACFQGVLEALVATKSTVILMFVVKISAADPKHVIEHELRKAIEKYAKGHIQETLLSDLEMLFKLFCQHSYTHEIRLTILKRFLLGILKACPVQVVTRFYQTSFENVMKLVNGHESVKHSLIDKIGGFQLLEILYGVCTKEFLETPESPLYDPARKTSASTVGIIACRDEFKHSLVNPDLDTSEYFRKVSKNLR